MAAREAAIFIGHTYRVSKLANSFGFGWETGRIAQAIATGHGFSSPFQAGTGPTAWIAPIYPYLLAGVFKLFGVYTTASAIAILSLNSVFSALTVIPVFHIARRTFGRRVAVWSGWLAALFPYAWYWAIKWAWETSLATLMLACVFLLTLRMAGICWIDENEVRSASRSRLSDWLLFGFLWGLIALTNPSLMLWLPFAGLILIIRQIRAEHDSRPLLHAVAAGVLFIAIVSPWAVRNYEVFHKFIPVRGNFGAELRMGNGESAVGLWRFWMHPSSNPIEFKKYRSMGEVAYVKSKQAEAQDFIHSHPAMFAKLCFFRFLYYWYDVPRDPGLYPILWVRNVTFLLSSILAFAGLWAMWRRKHPATLLYGSLLLAIPMIYYVTFPHPRYRAPIEPEMLVLIVGLFSLAERRRTEPIPAPEVRETIP
jgi:4-amino-4-deoxy-L-arabinose transferase-like glycosyltransferase